jgi:predicted dehydrogenase
MQKKEVINNAINRRQFLTRASVISAAIMAPRFLVGCNSPSNEVSLGFIGTGKQAMSLQRSFLKTEEIRILAAADVYDSKLQRFASMVPGCDTYSDFRKILDRKDIDAVVIAVPDHWHAAIAVMAAKAGKDIYCEKPLSLTIKEGRAMVTAARENKRVFQTGSMQRSWPEFRQAVELVRNGYIGEIKHVIVNVGGPPKPYDLPAESIPAGVDWEFWLGPNIKPAVFNHNLAPGLNDDFWAHWRDYREFGGGYVTDWGAHMFDIAQWGLDMDSSGPVMVTPPDKDHPFLTYQYANGITMTHEPVSKDNGVTFIGTKGEVHVVRGKLKTKPEALFAQVIGDNEKHVYKSENHYSDFLQAVRKRSKPVADVEIGHRTATVCNIGNIAYALNRPLQWDPVKEEFKNDAEANKLTGREMKKEWAVI